MVFRETPVEAYLDPGSGSMLVQLLLGGFAGAAVILKLGWQRLRGWFSPLQEKDRPARSDD
jgi:hypothetical protein